MGGDVDAAIATPVGLDVWKDPQGFVLSEQVRDEVWCYFQCWTENGSSDRERVGCLHFVGVWHLASTRFGATKGYPNVRETALRSYYLLVEDSPLLVKLAAQRSEHDPDWQRCDRRCYRHWIVESHDFYTDIVAAQVEFNSLTGAPAARCFAIWDNV